MTLGQVIELLMTIFNLIAELFKPKDDESDESTSEAV